MEIGYEAGYEVLTLWNEDLRKRISGEDGFVKVEEEDEEEGEEERSRMWKRWA